MARGDGRLRDLLRLPYSPTGAQRRAGAAAPGGGDASPLGYRHALPQDYGTVPVEVVRGPSAFDWGDALIGAGGALALLLLAGGATIATRHIRPPAAA